MISKNINENFKTIMQSLSRHQNICNRKSLHNLLKNKKEKEKVLLNILKYSLIENLN